MEYEQIGSVYFDVSKEADKTKAIEKIGDVGNLLTASRIIGVNEAIEFFKSHGIEAKPNLDEFRDAPNGTQFIGYPIYKS